MSLSKPTRLELMTSDADAALGFYGSVLGWQAEAEELPDGHVYHWLRDSRGRAVGGLYAMTEDLRRQGVAAHWVPEFQVTDADETVRRAKALGGRVSLDAFDLLGRGRLALVLDPTGAPLGLWQPAEGGAGAPPQPKASTPFWPELSTPDAGVAARFYHDLFEWHAIRHDGGERAYATFHSGAETVAGLLTIGSRFASVPAHWLAYVAVDDVDALVAKIGAARGRLLAPPHDVPGLGRQAIVSDPQGAVFGLIAPRATGAAGH